jgi:hypothetical protein
MGGLNDFIRGLGDIFDLLRVMLEWAALIQF